MLRRDPWVGATKRFSLTDFTGGLNLADPPSVLAPNELLKAENMQFSQSGRGMRVRDGLALAVSTLGTLPLPRSSSVLLHGDGNGLYFASSGELYKATYAGAVVPLGSLSGTKHPVVETWGDPAVGLLIASGGKLQYLLNGVLATLDDSSPCDYVTKIGGRVVTSGQDGSRILLSGLGDETNWAIDGETWTDLDALWVDIGYKSGGQIVNITKIARDMVIFKSDGIIYRLVGEYPDWRIYEVGHDVRCVNSQSAKQLGNDIVFLDSNYGIHKVSQITNFGDITVSAFGREINNALIPEAGEAARVWTLPSRGELWIKPGTGSKKVYVYNQVTDAWTTYLFPLEPFSARTVGKDVYVTLKGTTTLKPNGIIYKMNAQHGTDFDQPIASEVTLRPVVSDAGRIVLHYSDVLIRGTGQASYEVNGHTLASRTGEGRMISRQVVMGGELTLTVKGSGRFDLEKVTVDVVEV